MFTAELKPGGSSVTGVPQTLLGMSGPGCGALQGTLVTGQVQGTR